MTPNFNLAEFEHSESATRAGLDNTLPQRLMAQAEETLQMMERIRAALSAAAGRPVPITITSGYRSPAVNALVRGSRMSDHIMAQACDWIAPRFGSPYECCRLLAPRVDDLGIGQLIHEFGRWVHVSTRKPSKAVNRIITITAAGTTVGIVPA